VILRSEQEERRPHEARDKHRAAESHLAPRTHLFVCAEEIRVPLLGLQRDALPHDAYAVDRDDQRAGVGIEQIP
jgi:hypothetical protein